MVALSRRAPLSTRLLLTLLLVLASTDRLAYQDLASLLVNQPGVAERARSFFLSNSFASLRTATFSLPRPLGAAIPQLPVSIHLDITGSVPFFAPDEMETDELSIQIVNRSNKADRLVTEAEAAKMAADSLAKIEIANSTSVPAEPRADNAGTLAHSAEAVPAAGAISRISRLFFGTDNAELPPLEFEHRAEPEAKIKLAALNPASAAAGATTIAPKGLVTGEEGQPKSPAERLGLSGAALAKAEKCLADAIYFESRGETERGQTAVAQVVINRVFSGFYPENVCGTVYQNAHRYLACQFTFACEGKKLTVNEPDMWEQAKRISRDMLDGKLWLAEVGKATHYHAYWVKPDWIREMRKIKTIGVHTFYRPKAWEG